MNEWAPRWRPGVGGRRHRPFLAVGLVRWSIAVRVVSIGLVASLALASAEPARAGQSSDAALDEAFAAFWVATSDTAVVAAAERVLATDPDIETVWSRLRLGRPYSGEVPAGRQLLTRSNRDGVEHAYVLLIPESYDPSVRYPVRVYLHGGVMRPQRDDGWWRNEERVMRDDAIVVIPSSWDESIWWQDSQIENLAGILTAVKRTYNVDENRVYLLGISDGATGAYYHAFKAATPWAGFLAFIGHPVVLANPSSGVDGEMHVTNLRNKPLFIINGGRDRLYPVAAVVPFLRLFRDAGVQLDFRPQPEAGHDTTWWESEAAAMDSFMDDVQRRPMPAALSWETESVDRYNRAHWLVITELGSVEGESDLDPFNTVADASSGTPLGISTLGELQDGSGVKVFEVAEDSIASAAGMVSNDTIVEIEGREAPTVEDLKNALTGFAPGDRLRLAVDRGGEQVEIVFVYPETAAPRTRTAFPHRQPSGRVEVRVAGRNQVRVATQGVRRFTLLLSPEEFDFTAPMTVVTNGATSFEGMVEPDIGALLRWAAVDQDRTMMFGAELEIEVTPAP